MRLTASFVRPPPPAETVAHPVSVILPDGVAWGQDADPRNGALSMRTPSKPARLLMAAAVSITVAITMTACASRPAPVLAGATPTKAAGDVTIPDTPAGRQLGWLLEAVPRAPVQDAE